MSWGAPEIAAIVSGWTLIGAVRWWFRRRKR